MICNWFQHILGWKNECILECQFTGDNVGTEVFVTDMGKSVMHTGVSVTDTGVFVTKTGVFVADTGVSVAKK